MWKEENNKLPGVFKFKDFIDAFSFITGVAMIAERMNHHPDWKNFYNVDVIELTTHDAGKQVIEKDRHLAMAIDDLYNRFAIQ